MTFDAVFFIGSVLLAGVFLYFGHSKNQHIFNIFAVGVFIFLMTQLWEFTALMVVFIAISIYELWFAFLGRE